MPVTLYVSVFTSDFLYRLIANKYIQDDRAKTERDRVKWNALSEEIVGLKKKVGSDFP